MELRQSFAEAVRQHRHGATGAASSLCATILSHDPDFADAWHLAGLIAHQVGRTDDGLAHVQHAIRLRPENAEYYGHLSSILLAADKCNAALEAADAAVRLAAESPAAWYHHGSALHELGQHEQAIFSLTRAIDLGIDQPAAWNCLGLSKINLGHFSQAVVAFESSLAVSPRQASPWYHLSKLVNTGDYQFSKDQIAGIESLID